MVNTTAFARSRSRRSAVPQYIALAVVLAAVLVYEIRYAAYRYPNWFQANAAEYPFLVFPDDNRPQTPFLGTRSGLFGTLVPFI